MTVQAPATRPGGNGQEVGIDDAFIPSRGRDLAENAAAGATGRQPAGHALPSMIVGEPKTPYRHVRAAQAVPKVAPLVNDAVPSAAHALISAISRGPAAVVTRRYRAVDASPKVSAKLEPYRKLWADALPVDSPARAINFPP